MIQPVFLQHIINKKNFLVDIKNPLSITYHNIRGSLFKCGLGKDCMACRMKVERKKVILLDIMFLTCRNGNWYTDKEKVLWASELEYQNLIKNNKFLYVLPKTIISPYLLKGFFIALPHNKEKKAREIKGHETLNRIITNKIIHD